MKENSHHGAPNPTELVQTLFIKHEGVIRAFVRGLAPSFDEADDIVQETFVTVSRKARSFEVGTDFVAWACSIAKFKALESYRQRKRAGTLSEAAILALSEDFPAAELIRAREAALNRCIEKLAPRSRELLWRRYLQREDSNEMAGGLGITANAVRVALSKVRAFLRKCVSIELKNAS